MKYLRSFKFMFFAFLLSTPLAAFCQSQAWLATNTKATDTGSANAVFVSDMQSGEAIPVKVALQLRNKPQLDAAVALIVAGKAPRLTTQQIKSDYLPTDAQVHAVMDYLSQKGFINVTPSKDNLLVSADGTTATVNAAFQAKMQHFNVNGRLAHANVTDAVVPQSLGGIVQGVLGLQDVYVPKSHAIQANSLAPLATAAAAGLQPHNATDFASIYGASSLTTATTANINIVGYGLMQQTASDLSTFASINHFPNPALNIVYLDCLHNCVGNVTPTVGSECGTPATPPNGTVEANLDTQSALAAAGGTITIINLYSNLGNCNAAWTSLYDTLIQEMIANIDYGQTNQVLSISFGEWEYGNYQDSSMTSQDNIFELGLSLGITITASTGDSGAWTPYINASGQTAWAQAVNYPASSPYVIAVGGTSLTTTQPNSTPPSSSYPSAGIAYVSETAWSCTSLATCATNTQPTGGSSGGPSVYEKAPAWQSVSGTKTGTTFRAIPDIAFDADPNSGEIIILDGSTVHLTNGQYYYNLIGGTSLSAPLFAGFWSRIQSDHLATKGNTPYSFPAQRLYTIAGAPNSTFHKITSGTNGVYSVPSTGAWNFVTGYGSFNVSSLFANY